MRVRLAFFKRLVVAVGLIVAPVVAFATPINYLITWTGYPANFLYTMTGKFTIDSSKADASVEEADLLAFSITVFRAPFDMPNNKTSSTFVLDTLHALPSNFNFNFNAVTGKFLLGGAYDSAKGQDWNYNATAVNCSGNNTAGFITTASQEFACLNGTRGGATIYPNFDTLLATRVPEPETLPLLMLAGLAALAARHTRRSGARSAG